MHVTGFGPNSLMKKNKNKNYTDKFDVGMLDAKPKLNSIYYYSYKYTKKKKIDN